MSEIMAALDPCDATQLSKVLKTYSFDSSNISYAELLQPDGTMLRSDGTVRDVSAAFDFSKEAQKGRYLSTLEYSSHAPHEKVLRSAVPVIRDGQTAAILYGIVRLSDLAAQYTTNLYEGNAYVYVVDGDSGDFLLDTWHSELGNIYEPGTRQMLPGYSLTQWLTDLRNGIVGQTALISQSTGHTLYTHYEPIGVNNWNVMLTVEETYAMNESKTVSDPLYHMAAFIVLILLVYMSCITSALFQAYRQMKRIGSEDQTTGLRNRNAFDALYYESQSKTFPLLTCAYVDVNGLHEVNNRFGHKVGDQMLRIVADALRKEFTHAEIYRIGGDEFVMLSETDDLDACQTKMLRVNQEIESHEYHVSMGIISHRNELGLDRITQKADELMLENKREFYRQHGSKRT